MKMIVKTDNGGTLNLRNAPGGSILLKIPNNTTLDVEVDGEWAKTTYQSKTGYVMSKYLISTETSTKDQLQKVYDSLKSTLKTIEEVLN